MVIVITPESDIVNEVPILHKLFESGLTCCHVRKPHKSGEELLSYLHKIDAQYHHRLVLHSHHELTQLFTLRGVHIREQQRIDLGAKLKTYFTYYKDKGLTISSAYHDPAVLDKEEIRFDYHFLSPIFSSISKKGYRGRGFEVNHILNKTIMGMGGIVKDTLLQTLSLGYHGVGVLGGVWHAKDPVKSFKEIKETFEQLKQA